MLVLRGAAAGIGQTFGDVIRYRYAVLAKVQYSLLFQTSKNVPLSCYPNNLPGGSVFALSDIFRLTV